MIAELAAALLWTNFSVMLQRGRNQMITELIVIGDQPFVAYMLQWVRDQLIAEFGYVP